MDSDLTSLEFKVSVIIPVYNREQFIRKAVESANQLEETGEILIIEDGSTDKTLEICNRLKEEFPKVVVYQHADKKNHGVSESRNLGIAQAKNEFIAFLDSDDYYLSNRFEKDKEILLQYPNIDGVYNALGIHYYTETGKNSFIEAGYQYQEFYTLSGMVPPMELFYALFGLHPKYTGEFSTDTITVRNRLFKKSGLFNTKLKIKEDTHLWRRMAAVGLLAPGNISKPVAIRGVHDQNTIIKTAYQPEADEIWWDDLNSWINKNNLNKYYKLNFQLAYLINQINSNVPKVKWLFWKFVICNLNLIPYQYGWFDNYFLKLYDHKKIAIHFISLKNKICKHKETSFIWDSNKNPLAKDT